MEHLVRFTSSEGRDGYHTTSSLDDAVRFVERLRNHEDAQDVHLFRMSEVPIEFRTYYRVEVRSRADGETEEPGSGGDAGGYDAPPPALSSLPAVPSPMISDMDAMSPSKPQPSGRRLFSR